MNLPQNHPTELSTNSAGQGDTTFPCNHFAPDVSTPLMENFPFGMMRSDDHFSVHPSGLISTQCEFTVLVAGSSCSQCKNLEHNTRVKDLIRIANEPAPPSSNHNRCTITHLTGRLYTARMNIGLNRLKLMKEMHRVGKLVKRLDMHKRLVVLISENDIPRLHAVVSAEMRRGAGIHSMLETLKAANDDSYHARGYTQKENDFGFLCGALGGRSMVFAANQLGLCPSVRSQKRREQDWVLIPMADDIDVAVIRKNIDAMAACRADLPKVSRILKIMVDEVKVNPEASFNLKINQIEGLVSPHTSNINRVFNTMAQIEEMQRQVKVGNLLIGTDALVYCVGETVVTILLRGLYAYCLTTRTCTPLRGSCTRCELLQASFKFIPTQSNSS